MPLRLYILDNGYNFASTENGTVEHETVAQLIQWLDSLDLDAAGTGEREIATHLSRVRDNSAKLRVTIRDVRTRLEVLSSTFSASNTAINNIELLHAAADTAIADWDSILSIEGLDYHFESVFDAVTEARKTWLSWVGESYEAGVSFGGAGFINAFQGCGFLIQNLLSQHVYPAQRGVDL